MKKKFVILDLYTLLTVLYLLKSIIYPRGTLLSYSINGLYVILTMILTYASMTYTKLPKLLKTYLAFIILLTFYGLLLYLSGETITVKYNGVKTGGSNYLEAILYSNLPIYAYYYIFKKNYYSLTHFKILAIVFFAVSIVLFYHQQALTIEERSEGRFEDEIINNEAYLFVSLIPLLCIFEKQRIIQFAGVAICFTFLMLGMKRGALLTGTIEIIVLLLYHLRNAKRKTKIFVFVISSLLLYFAYQLFQKMLDKSDLFAYRYQLTLEGYSSHRDEISSQILLYFQSQMTSFDLLFGRGAMATIKMFDNYAHNDWLELMVCQGVLGVTLYLIFFIQLITALIKEKESLLKISLFLLFIALFLPTLYSMSYNSVSFSLSCYFGYIASKIK